VTAVVVVSVVPVAMRVPKDSTVGRAGHPTALRVEGIVVLVHPATAVVPVV